MAYDSKTECRKWQLTINNPVKLGFDHRKITELLMRFKPSYFCMADEISESGTPHTHAFIMVDSPIRFTTLKSRFPIAHLEMAKGSAQENRDYITKSGKWSDTDKAHTSVEDTFEEWGEVPTPKKEKAPVMTQVMEAIKAGKTTAEIVEEHPGLAFKIQQIDTLRQTLLAEKYMTENRDIKVTYMYGATGAGKTRGIYANGPMHVY